VWTGNANLETSKEYFGVNQRIRVVGGGQDSVSQAFVDNTARRYRTREVVLRSALIKNTNDMTTIIDESDYIVAASVHSRDLDNRNVIIRLEFPISKLVPSYDVTIGGTIYSFNRVGLNLLSLEAFRSAFRVIQGTDDWRTNNDLRYVDVVDVRFAAEAGDNQMIINNIPRFNNVVYLTLDPSFRLTGTLSTSLSVLINNNFSYATRQNQPRIHFGNFENLMFRNFRQYNLP
jgi:hypothetical protein